MGHKDVTSETKQYKASTTQQQLVNKGNQNPRKIGVPPLPLAETNSSRTTPDDFVNLQVSDWDLFDESAYIHGGSLRIGEDPYIRNNFNQQASDSISSYRDIPDTRQPM